MAKRAATQASKAGDNRMPDLAAPSPRRDAALKASFQLDEIFRQLVTTARDDGDDFALTLAVRGRELSHAITFALSDVSVPLSTIEISVHGQAVTGPFAAR